MATHFLVVSMSPHGANLFNEKIVPTRNLPMGHMHLLLKCFGNIQEFAKVLRLATIIMSVV